MRKRREGVRKERGDGIIERCQEARQKSSQQSDLEQTKKKSTVSGSEYSRNVQIYLHIKTRNNEWKERGER